MAEYVKSSDGISYYRRPVHKPDPDLGSYEACRSVNQFSDRTMYVQSSTASSSAGSYSLKIEITPDMMEVCRLCTTPGIRQDMLPIFLHLPFAARVVWVSDLQISEGDGLPLHVCNNCKLRVDSAFEFKTLCWESDKALRRQKAKNRKKPKETVFLEDIAQVNLPVPDEPECSVLEDMDRVDMLALDEESIFQTSGPRILSCTSLTKAEEALLLSGKLTGDKEDDEHTRSPVSAKKKKSQLYHNYYNNEDFDPPLKRGQPRKKNARLKQRSKNEAKVVNVGEVTKRGRPRKRLLEKDEVLIVSPVRIDDNLNPEASSSSIAFVEKDCKSSASNAGTDGSIQTLVDPLRTVAERDSGDIEKVGLLDGREGDAKTTVSSEKQSEAREISHLGKGTEPCAPKAVSLQSLFCSEEKLPPSPQSRLAGKSTTVEAKSPLFVAVSVQKEEDQRCSPQGSPRSSDCQGNYLGSCNNYESLLATAVSGPAGADTPHIISICKEREDDGSDDEKNISTVSIANKHVEETTRRKRGRPRIDQLGMLNTAEYGSMRHVVETTRRKRGRPRKVQLLEMLNTAEYGSTKHVPQKRVLKPKEPPQETTRGTRGRPRKIEASDDPDVATSSTQGEPIDKTLEPGSSTGDKISAAVEEKSRQCTDCGMEFSLKKDLLAHLTDHGTQAVMKCECCHELFCVLGRYNTHTCQHKRDDDSVEEVEAPPPKTPVEKRMWKCADCHKEFNAKKGLTAHLTNHGTRVTMQCSYCCAVYCSLGRFNAHVRAHMGQPNKLCVCDVCDMRFARGTDLQRHCRMHWAGEAHMCQVCGKALPLKASLEAHMKTEHGREKMFKCKFCDKPFSFLGSLKDHIRLKHPEEYVHQCDSCQEKFETAEALQQHITTHVGISCFTCSKCNKKFSIREVYMSHVKNHDRARPYICETCGKGFLNSSALKCHQRIHTGDRLYKCDMCDKAYTQFTSLRSHIRSHTDKRSYACSICGKSFGVKQALKRHMVAHSNLREFKCNVCDLEFLHKSNLNRHLSNQHGLVGKNPTR